MMEDDIFAAAEKSPKRQGFRQSNSKSRKRRTLEHSLMGLMTHPEMSEDAI